MLLLPADRAQDDKTANSEGVFRARPVPEQKRSLVLRVPRSHPRSPRHLLALCSVLPPAESAPVAAESSRRPPLVSSPVAPHARARDTLAASQSAHSIASQLLSHSLLDLIELGATFAASVVGWDKDFPALTSSALQSKRAEFWDTRSAYGGRSECWAALRLAGESDEATAQAILESAELTPLDVEKPEAAFSYDAKGFKYEVPLYCLYLPSNLKPDAPATPPGHVLVQPARGSRDEAEEKQLELAAATAAASPASGKALKFKVRFSNGAPDLAVDQRSSTSIGQIKAMVCAKYPELTPERLKIFYLGKCMSVDAWNLSEIGMKKDMVLQCFIPGVKSPQ